MSRFGEGGFVKEMVAGSLPFSPSNIAGLVAWWDFSDRATLWQDAARTVPITADGQTILGVTDKSGSGRPVSEATNGPTYKVAQQGGLSAALFDGTNDTLGGSGWPNVTVPWSLVSVHQQSPIAGANTLYRIGGPGLQQNPGGQDLQWVGGAADLTLQAFAPLAFAITFYLIDGANSFAYANTALIDTGNGGVASWSFFTYGNPGGPAFWDADVGETLVYQGRLTRAQINALGEFLAAKWGLSWTVL